MSFINRLWNGGEKFFLLIHLFLPLFLSVLVSSSWRKSNYLSSFFFWHLLISLLAEQTFQFSRKEKGKNFCSAFFPSYPLQAPRVCVYKHHHLIYTHMHTCLHTHDTKLCKQGCQMHCKILCTWAVNSRNYESPYNNSRFYNGVMWWCRNGGLNWKVSLLP